jgi:hypothetical protein
MDCRLTSTDNRSSRAARVSKRPQAGVTIAEFLIALGIAGVILAQLCLLWLYSSRSFAAQMTYTDMDQRSQRALDTLTQNLRQCKALTNFMTTCITLVDYDDRPLTFAFENGELRRIKNNVSKTVLTNCVSGQFAMYQRTPVGGSLDQYPTTDPNLCKLIEVRWVCSRRLVPTAPKTTETMQSARIALRVK